MTPPPDLAQKLSKSIGVPVSTEGAVRISDAILGAVEDSFLDPITKMRGKALRQEVIKRTELAYEIIRKLMIDYKWSTIKVADHLSEYVRCEIAGIHYTPGKAADGWVKKLHSANDREQRSRSNLPRGRGIR